MGAEGQAAERHRHLALPQLRHLLGPVPARRQTRRSAGGPAQHDLPQTGAARGHRQVDEFTQISAHSGGHSRRDLGHHLDDPGLHHRLVLPGHGRGPGGLRPALSRRFHHRPPVRADGHLRDDLLRPRHQEHDRRLQGVGAADLCHQLEALDIIVSHRSIVLDKKNEEDPVKDAVKNGLLKLLEEQFDISEEDFISAELEVVPAGKARDVGFDRSMILSYGQDDRVCAYTSFKAMLKVKDVSRTACCILVDKEEIGSVGATGMRSKFFENTVAEVLNLLGEYSELKLKRCLANCTMLSSDVSSAYDPTYSSSFDKKNVAYLGAGMVFNKFTGARGKSGSNDANAEYLGMLRQIFNEDDVNFQTSELGIVDLGGGGTIAYILALYGMNVIDSGVAVLNMHAPWEATSKADIYEAYRGYGTFLKKAVKL